MRESRDSIFAKSGEYPGMNPRNDEIREWLRARLAAAGRGARQRLARYLGLPRPDAITRMLNTDPAKESREIKAHEYEAMRKFFGDEPLAPVDGVSGPVPVSPKRVPYGGEVRAGGFYAVNEYFSQDAGDHIVPETIIEHPRFSQLKQYAWMVHGDSMDMAGITDGTWAVAAEYAEYRDRVGELYNGQKVIVERRRHGGSEIERTVKEVQFTRGGIRLVPRSSNAVHKELFVPHDAEADNDKEEIRILAVVLSTIQDHSKPPE